MKTVISVQLQLQARARKFRAEVKGVNWQRGMLATQCTEVSIAFNKYLKNIGIAAKLLKCSGYKGPAMSADRVADYWHKDKNFVSIIDDPSVAIHFVSLVGSTYVDLTGEQFGWPPVIVKPLSELKRQWQRVVEVTTDLEQIRISYENFNKRR